MIQCANNTLDPDQDNVINFNPFNLEFISPRLKTFTDLFSSKLDFFLIATHSKSCVFLEWFRGKRWIVFYDYFSNYYWRMTGIRNMFSIIRNNRDFTVNILFNLLYIKSLVFKYFSNQYFILFNVQTMPWILNKTM